MHKLTFQSYGVRISVETDTPDTLGLIRHHLPFGWEPAPDGEVDRHYMLTLGKGASVESVTPPSLRCDGVELSYTDDLDELLESLESLLQVDVAELAPDRVFIHAGVVGWRGKAIILPGRSFTGKTTLVTALVMAGATYYSDEYAVLDRTGRVHPFTRPLCVRDDIATRGRKISVESLGGIAGKLPLQVGRIILSKFTAGSAWEPEYLSPGEGLLEMLANAVPVRRRPEEVIDVLLKVVEHGAVLRATRGEAEQAARAVLSFDDLDA